MAWIVAGSPVLIRAIATNRALFTMTATIAPEQLSGASMSVTRRTDIYAAGVVLWEALTLERLFVSDEPGPAMSPGGKNRVK